MSLPEKPTGMTIDYFECLPGQTIRYAMINPNGADKQIFLLSGLFECFEKYYEAIEQLIKRNFAIAIMDWPYQGGSYRLTKPKYRIRRHSDGFDQECRLFHHFVTKIIKPSLPCYLFGHSMGGHQALRFLQEYNDIPIERAFLSAPMVDIKSARAIQGIAPILTQCLIAFGQGKAYAPGGADWQPSLQKLGEHLMSDDPERKTWHRLLFERDPTLISCGPTWGWVHAALHSIKQLHQNIDRITVPCRIVYADYDVLVSNQATRNFAAQSRFFEAFEIPGSKHELLMGTQNIRDIFWDNFDHFMLAG